MSASPTIYCPELDRNYPLLMTIEDLAELRSTSTANIYRIARQTPDALPGLTREGRALRFASATVLRSLGFTVEPTRQQGATP